MRLFVHVVVPKEPTSCAELASSDGSLRRWKPFNLQNGQCHLQPDPFPAAHHHRWRWWFPVEIPDAPIACPPGRSEQPNVVDWFRDRVDSGCQYSMVICKYDWGNKVWKLHERIWQLRFRKLKVRILALWHFLGHVYFRGTREHDQEPSMFQKHWVVKGKMKWHQAEFSRCLGYFPQKGVNRGASRSIRYATTTH